VPGESGLRQASRFLDHWSAPDQAIDLPAYICPSGAEAATTSILIPFGTPKPMGVLNLECNHQRSRRNRCTATARSQLVRLAEMLGILTRRYEAQLQRLKGCRESVRNLRTRFDTRIWPQLLHPRIFVAFSERADREIVRRLRLVVREISERYELDDVFWDEINDTGNITQAMIQRISTCHCGVCYFSEPATEASKTRFQDNPNVLFEAGMLHSLTHRRASELFGWVPIRELESPILPFDFAQQRLIVIDRTVRNYRRKFEKSLRCRLEELIQAGPGVEGDGPTAPRDSPFPPRAA